MKKIIFAFLITLYIQSALAQNTTIAKLKFESAEESFDEGKYEACIKKLNEAEKLFGKSNPPISHLKISAIHKMLEIGIEDKRKNYTIELIVMLINESDLYMKNYSSLSGAEDKTREVFKIQEKYESEIIRYKKITGLQAIVSEAQKGNQEAAYKLAELYAKEDLDVAALKWYIKSADKGHITSMVKIYSLKYNLQNLEGYEEVSETEFANKYLLNAFEKGNLEAMIIYAYNLSGGYNDTPKDLKAAIALYLKVLEKGNVEVLPDLAYAYYQLPDYKKAFDYNTKGIEMGELSCYFGLATLYIEGKGVELDYAKAMEYYKVVQNKQPKQGGGYFHMGDLYKYGFGVEKNYKNAFDLYQKAAEVDRAYESIVAKEVGLLYFQGGYGLAQDYGKALKYFTQEKYLENNYYLGQMYEKGLGVSPDYAAAMNWYKKAAKRNHTGAIRNIGNLYEKGLGVSLNYATAMEWYFKAANSMEESRSGAKLYYEKGLDIKLDKAEAMRRIGQLYEKGMGVKKDKIIAQEWYQKAIAEESKK